MTCTTVTNQAELDAALAVADPSCIHIESERGVWLRVGDNQGHRLELRDTSSAVLWGTSSAVLRGTSSAELRDTSSAVLWDTSSAVLWDTSSAVLRGTSSAELRDTSSAVLRGTSSAELRDTSSAVLRDTSSAVLRDTSSAVLRGTSSAELRDTSSAELWGATNAHAYGRSKVAASSHVAVHLHSGQATVAGGVLIDLTALDMADPAVWAEHHGAAVDDGRITLYKATDAELVRGASYGKPTTYTVGVEVTASDWRDDHDCGGGLHLSPHPRMADGYAGDVPRGERRYLRATAAVEDVRVIEDKVKVRSCRVEAEVDIRGRELTVVKSAAS